MQDADRRPWPEDLRSARESLERVFAANPYRALLGAELERWGPGWAEVRLDPSSEHANIVGAVHGGVLASLADFAFEVACNSYGRICVAIELTAHYAAPASTGSPLLAGSLEESRSARTASYRIEIDQGRIRVATFMALAYRTSEWHVSEEELPPDWREAH